MSKKTKSAKYVQRRLDNRGTLTIMGALMNSQPQAFKSAMWDIFGCKEGQKIIDRVNSAIENNNAADNAYAPSAPLPSWDDFNRELCHGVFAESQERYGAEWKFSFEDPLDCLYKIADALYIALSNGDLYTIEYTIEFRSPFYSCSKTMTIPRNVLQTLIVDATDLKEAIFFSINVAMNAIGQSFIDVIKTTTLPEVVKNNCIVNAVETLITRDIGYRSYAPSALYTDVYAITALLVATISGYCNKYPYNGKNPTHFIYLGNVGSGCSQVGISDVKVTSLDANDTEQTLSYEVTDVPPYTSKNPDILTEIEKYNCKAKD